MSESNSRSIHLIDPEVNGAIATSRTEAHFSKEGAKSREHYEAARDVKAQAIIPLNPRNEKEPPAGITGKGTPCCQPRGRYSACHLMKYGISLRE